MWGDAGTESADSICSQDHQFAASFLGNTCRRSRWGCGNVACCTCLAPQKKKQRAGAQRLAMEAAPARRWLKPHTPHRHHETIAPPGSTSHGGKTHPWRAVHMVPMRPRSHDRRQRAGRSRYTAARLSRAWRVHDLRRGWWPRHSIRSASRNTPARSGRDKNQGEGPARPPRRGGPSITP